MRYHKRIDRVLKLIRKVWKKNPDLRLLQLLGNSLPCPRPDIYYVEDNVLEERIKEIYSKCD